MLDPSSTGPESQGGGSAGVAVPVTVHVDAVDAAEVDLQEEERLARAYFGGTRRKAFQVLPTRGQPPYLEQLDSVMSAMDTEEKKSALSGSNSIRAAANPFNQKKTAAQDSATAAVTQETAVAQEAALNWADEVERERESEAAQLPGARALCTGSSMAQLPGARASSTGTETAVQLLRARTSSAGSLDEKSLTSSGFAGDNDDSEDDVVVEQVFDMDQFWCIMPTVLAYVRSIHAPTGMILLCLLDSGAGRSFIAAAAARALGKAALVGASRLLVHGVNGSSVSRQKCLISIEPRHQDGWQKKMELRMLEQLGEVKCCPVHPHELGQEVQSMAEDLPRRESRTIDIILGQDVLWDVYTGLPTRMEGPGLHVALYPSRFGIVVGGVMGHRHAEVQARASLLLHQEPSFHLLHPSGVDQDDNNTSLMLAFDGSVEEEAAALAHQRAQAEAKEAKAEVKKLKPTDDLVTVGKMLEAFMRYENMGIEPPGEGPGASMSTEDLHALRSVNESLVFKDGKYSVGLTFAPNRPSLVDNKFKALKRMESNERMFDRVPDLKNKYAAAIQEFIDNGDIEKVEGDGPNGRTFYLPHKAVLREDKATTKTRVVFDGSARDEKGQSLNDCLLKGPPGDQDLLKILINFRWEKVAFSGDVRRMFLCIGVHQQDRDHLRFLWREDPKQEATIFRFKNVTFGLRDAPFVAQEVFKIHARKYQDRYPQAVDILLNKRWVDDLLTSVRSSKQAQQVIQQIRDIMLEGGFPVKKWISSDQAVMDSIPDEDRLDLGTPIKLTGVEDREGTIQDETKVSALGVSWFVEQDTFKVTGSKQMQLPPEMAITKRVVASKVSGIFDPLGLVIPFCMTGKRLLRKIWLEERAIFKKEDLKGSAMMRAQKKIWDRPISDPLAEEFRAWYSQVNLLRDFSIPRCLIDKDKVVKERQLHIFGDASPFGCAAAAYSRTEYMGGQVTVMLVNAKSRVAPAEDSGEGESKANLPRLELVAAVMAKRVADKILEDHPATEVFYWTDSSVAYQWILTGVLDKKIWVANRVREILTTTRPDQWRHVPGLENPADLGTRGISCQDFLASLEWKQGPAWLAKPQEEWPARSFKLQEQEQEEFASGVTKVGSKEQRETLMMVARDEAVKPTVLTTESPKDPLSRIQDKAGSVEKMVGATILFKYKEKNAGLPVKSPERIEEALRLHIGLLQRLYYQAEMEALEAGEGLLKSSSLLKVTPFLDEHGLMRAKGRVPLGVTRDPPIILPKQAPLTKLLMMQAHQKCAHQGANWTKFYFANKYWCSKMELLSRQVSSSCVLCQKMRKAVLGQSVGELPPWRMEETPRPFTYVGVDYAGPIWSYKAATIRDGRRKLVTKEKDKKLYVILYTCMQIRAVHLELVDSQAVEPLNMATRRFMGRKGRPKVFYSDNAKSFHRAATELEVLQELHSSAGVRKTLQSEGIRWLFMPERAPWWGGLHERLVGVMKNVLRVTLQGCYTQEEIHTFLVEAEALVNSRPLGKVAGDPGEPLPVTPSELLYGYKVVDSPVPSIGAQGTATGIKRLWARRQHLIRAARARFVKDYLQLLREIRKTEATREEPLQVGDLVLYEDGNAKRTEWPMGRVLELFTGRDGLVRAALIKTAAGNTRRPLQKLVVLEAAGLEEQDRSADSADEETGLADSAQQEAAERTAQENNDDETAVNKLSVDQASTKAKSELAERLAETLEFVRSKRRDLASKNEEV